MEKIIGKWQFWCKPFKRRPWMVDGIGWHLFECGFIKIHTVIGGGVAFGKNNYHGFIIRFMWWFPLDIA